MSSLYNVYRIIFDNLSRFLLPIILLSMRLWMAKIFWHSGQTKLSDWSSTVSLFKGVYKVPYLSPEIAAYLATIIELTCPVLLVLGLATRLATIPMLAMVAVIHFTFLNSPEHFVWAVMLGTILCSGAGCISLDSLFKRKLCS